MIKYIDNIEPLRQMIEKFGSEMQIEMVTEECAELIQAIQRLKRAKSNHNSEEPFYKSRLENVHEEIADVYIMLQQCFLIFDADEINKQIEIKMERVKELIA